MAEVAAPKRCEVVRTDQCALQAATAPTEQSNGDAHVQHRALDSYPDRLFAIDMAAIFRVSLRRFYTLDAEGAFLFAQNKRIGRKSWAKARVAQYFDGELSGLTVARKRA